MKSLMFILYFPLFFAFTTERKIAEDDLKEYTGVYKMKSYFQKTTVELRDGALYGDVDGNGFNKLIKQETPDTFKSTSSYGTIYIFLRDDKTKKISGVTLQLMGQEVSGDKM